MELWHAATGQLIRTFDHADWIKSVALSRDGTRLLSGGYDKTLKLWDAATGQLIRTFEGHANEITLVAFSPDGTRLLSGSLDETLKLWDAATGQVIRTFEGHLDPAWSAAFSPDGARLVSAGGRAVRAGGDYTLKLWDAATGQVIRTFDGHTSVVTSVAFSPDGTRVPSGSWDNTLKLWDAATGQLVRTFEEHADMVRSVAFSPDGTRLLSSSDDRSLKLWDAATGRLIRTLEGHTGSVSSVGFSPDGRQIVSGSTDTTIRLWDSATGAQLAMLFGGRDGEWLAMTPKGFFAASRKGTELLSVVRGLEAYSVMQFYGHLHRPDLVEELLKGDRNRKYREAARTINLESIIESGAAPRIELQPNRTEKTDHTIKLAAKFINVDGGGIGSKVIWRINGRTRGTTTLPLSARDLSYVIMEQTLPIDTSKKNEIEIIAYNGEGKLASVPLRRTIDPWGVTDKERPRLFVLAVAVDDYISPELRLSHAANDARALVAALKKVGEPMFSEVQPKTLLNPEATERGIAAEFERLRSIIKPRDVFVLFVGGHGKSYVDTGWFYLPADLDGDKGHLIETHGIGTSKWQAWMAKIPAEKTLVILDACESGASQAFRSLDRERESVMAQLEHATGDNFITAAPAGKAAYEGYKGHGVLTYAILEALHREKKTGEEHAFVSSIAHHVGLRVPDISQRVFLDRQKPVVMLRENFPLGVRTAVLKDAPILIPTAPTHYTKAPLRVFKETGGKGGVVQQLNRNAGVTLLKSERGWAQIAREGKALGFVPERQLQKIE